MIFLSTKYFPQMLDTIYDDINYDAEAITITDINYEPGSLTNNLYNIIEDKDFRQKILKKNKVKGLYKDLYQIQTHMSQIDSDEKIQTLLTNLFKQTEIGSITALDKIFINCYYRHILRAKLELDFIGKEYHQGLILTKYSNIELDAILTKTLGTLRVICNYLGLKSTTTAGTFSIEKLDNNILWPCVGSIFIELFGETRIPDIGNEFNRIYVFMLLNCIFNTWSGSVLSHDNEIVTIIPATYVTRMVFKLK